MRMLPFLLMTLHLSQIGFTDALTFIKMHSFQKSPLQNDIISLISIKCKHFLNNSHTRCSLPCRQHFVLYALLRIALASQLAAKNKCPLRGRLFFACALLPCKLALRAFPCASHTVCKSTRREKTNVRFAAACFLLALVTLLSM